MTRHLTALCATPSSLCSKRQARLVVSHLRGERSLSVTDALEVSQKKVVVVSQVNQPLAPGAGFFVTQHLP
jgi:hypothetical protein